VRTIFLTESSVGQPLVARGEVKQLLKEQQFFGSRWEQEGRASSDPDVNGCNENNGGKD